MVTIEPLNQPTANQTLQDFPIKNPQINHSERGWLHVRVKDRIRRIDHLCLVGGSTSSPKEGDGKTDNSQFWVTDPSHYLVHSLKARIQGKDNTGEDILDCGTGLSLANLTQESAGHEAEGVLNLLMQPYGHHVRLLRE